MRSKKLIALTLASLMALSLAACGNKAEETPATTPTDEAASTDEAAPAEDGGAEVTASGDVANADKPVIWFNRQPSNSTTGELDMDALTFNDKTYYVGFDAVQGAELQGQMIVEYLQAQGEGIDRNGDGVIGYVLCIGDIGHNDSIARTRGARLALGTAVPDPNQSLTEVTGINDVDSQPVGTNPDGSAEHVQDGSITIGGKEYVVRELASQEMKNNSGATWDAPTAGNAIASWSGQFGDQIDVVVSNNDGMGMAVFNAWSKDNNVPTFGYDANSDAVAAIADGYCGTISQNADIQAYLTLRVLRNALDDADIMTGISTPDAAGNVLDASLYKYDDATRSFYALNGAVTADNYESYLDATAPNAAFNNQLDEADAPTKHVWLDIFNSTDNFLNATYLPQLENYDGILNLDVEYIKGDGQTEANITDRLANPSEYDGFAINMVKTDNGAAYTSKLQ
ncbi:MAG: substrate-binding domain-containing protein [Lachnospiraceae bacterium]|nr:substrate-binding domain-containing protein [Lachnospiraceae bacterium]